MFNNCNYVIFLLLLVPYIESVRNLKDYVTHYETLSYNQTEIQAAHQRHQRSASPFSDAGVHLHFRSHDRDFRLRLFRDISIFSDNLEVLGSNGPLQVDISHIYHGHLVGEPGSAVFGSIIDGVFEGKIISPTGSFYIENARHYFLPHEQNQTIHSVIYNENYVKNVNITSRKGHATRFGIVDMQKSQRVEIERTADNENELPQHHKEVNYTCSLYIYIDSFLWCHIREGIPEYKDPTKKDTGKISEVNQKTIEEILSVIANHFNAVNYIFRDTEFVGRLKTYNIKFEVKKVKIDDDSSCFPQNSSSCEKNQFCMEHTDGKSFLNIYSLGNYDDFCLAYIFTYRYFIGDNEDILGMANRASASGNYGGICDKYGLCSDFFKKSLNTGVVTFFNNYQRVPPKISQLTLAHEIGHSFGAQHDPKECQPGESKGNYIMFETSIVNKPNSNKFSPCSIKSITKVLDAMGENRIRECFSIHNNTNPYAFVPDLEENYNFNNLVLTLFFAILFKLLLYNYI